jgi:hypothetical protein
MKWLTLSLATLALVLAGTASATKRVPLRLTPAAATALLAKGTFIVPQEVRALRDGILQIEEGNIDSYGLTPDMLPHLQALLVVAKHGHTVQPGSMNCVPYRGLPPVQGRYNGFRCAVVLNPLPPVWPGHWDKPSSGFLNVLLGKKKCPYPAVAGQRTGAFECISTPRYGYTWTGLHSFTDVKP